MAASAQEIIVKLGLAPHPEGGWFRETWREPAHDGGRGLATAILFLLEAGQVSHWRRVDAAELWLHQAGGPLLLGVAETDGTLTERRLGGDILSGDLPQALVKPGQWQSARALEGWALVACVVAPAFEFGGFELAPPGWTPDSARKTV